MNAITVPESVAIARPDPLLIQSVDEFLSIARLSYGQISTAHQCEAAAEGLKSIKARQKQLEDARTSITKPLVDAQRAVNNLFRAPQETLAEAERIIKRGILSYQDAEERKRLEAEAAPAEALRKEREKLEAQAARAQASGKHEKAEALRITAAEIPERMEIAATIAKVTGLASRSNWRAELLDKLAFVTYVAQHPEWLNLLEPNMTALNGLARSQKSALALPGVKAVEERQLAARAV
jgi:colicin import membrane protein